MPLPIIEISVVILSSYFIAWILTKFVLTTYLQKAINNSATKIDNYLFDAVIKLVPSWSVVIALQIWLNLNRLPQQYNNIFQTGLALTIIFLSVLILQNLIAKLLVLFIKKNGIVPQSSVITILGRLLIITFGILFALQYVGISITPLLTALGVGGLAVALALQPTLENLFSGLQLLASKKIIPGNYIKLEDGQKGYVEDITWRNTVIRELSNNRIIIPNKKISDAVLVNYHQPSKDMSVVITMGVSYDSDLEKVEQTVVEVATETMKQLPEIADVNAAPFVRYSNFGDFAIEFSVILRVQEFVGKYELTHEFIKNIHKRFEKEKISIPFPTRSIIMEKNT